MNSTPNRSTSGEASLAALELVRQAFSDAGWRVEAEPVIPDEPDVPWKHGSAASLAASAPSPDLLVGNGSVRYAVQIKAIPHGNSMAIEDHWSRACLQAQFWARDDLRPMAVVVAPRVAEKSVARLRQFAARYAPNVAMGVLDLDGLQAFQGDALEALSMSPVRDRDRFASLSPVSRNLFSPLNQWLLKLLLAPELPLNLLGGPRQAYRNATELAAIAGCSVMAAHRLVEALRSEGFLDKDARILRPVRRSVLFAQWQEANARRSIEQRYRFIVRRDERDELDQLFATGRACLGLFAAADELGAGFVSGVPPHVLVSSVDILSGPALLTRGARNLVPAAPGEPVHVIIRVPKARSAVFNCTVTPRGTPCSDILQVWLDVFGHEARGREQADLIWERYLLPLVSGVIDE